MYDNKYQDHEGVLKAPSRNYNSLVINRAFDYVDDEFDYNDFYDFDVNREWDGIEDFDWDSHNPD